MNLDLGNPTDYAPWKSLMLYRAVGKEEDVVLFEHDAHLHNGKVRLGEGRLAVEESIGSIVKALSLAMHVKPRILHPRVLVDVPGLFAWWMPAGRRIQAFDVSWHKDTKGRERLQNRSANLPHPALLFVERGVGNRCTHLFALKESVRPEGSTEVFAAPFLNLNLNGWVCWGSTSLPRGAMQETFTQVEEAFFSSTFSHLNQGSMVNAGERTFYEFLADLCDAPPEHFPVEVLKSVGTLDHVINQLSKGA